MRCMSSGTSVGRQPRRTCSKSAPGAKRGLSQQGIQKSIAANATSRAPSPPPPPADAASMNSTTLGAAGASLPGARCRSSTRDSQTARRTRGDGSPVSDDSPAR